MSLRKLFLLKTDKVFGPATTTRAVYDKAAQPIVNDAMDGMNGTVPRFSIFLSVLTVWGPLISGTVFAYGVTSSGKTHTMHVSLRLK